MLRALLVMLLMILDGCGGGGTTNSTSNPVPPGNGTPSSSSTTVPLNDLESGTYLGFTGGLYPSGSNTMPAQQHTAGLAHATAIHPLDINGNSNPSGGQTKVGGMLLNFFKSSTLTQCWFVAGGTCS